jgi:polysaccharide pyruvyl transferase WcaK-like protein
MTIPVVILNDTNADRHHGCARVMAALHLLIARHGMEVIAASPAHAHWRDEPYVVSAVDRAKLVIVNGEGTLHHDRPAGGWLLEAGAFARTRGVPAVLINASWDAMSDQFARQLGDFAIVAMRESRSRDQAKQWRDDIRLSGDLSLYCPHESAPLTKRAGVFFTDSVTPKVAGALTKARRRLGATPLPMFAYGRDSVDSARYLALAASRAQSPRLGDRISALSDGVAELAHLHTDQSRVLNQLSRASLLVTGRFHAACFALLTKTPLLCAETNTHKIEGLMDDCGLEAWRRINPAVIDQAFVDKASEWTATESAAIDRYLACVRQETDRMFTDMRALC